VNKLRLFLLPAVLLVILTIWFVVDGQRARRNESARFKLPSDSNPRALLEFMRKLDGSAESAEGLSKALGSSDNSLAICKAVLAASKLMPPNSPELSKSEQREASFYRVKYSIDVIMRGHEAEIQVDSDQLLKNVKDFLTSADSNGSREMTVAQLMLYVLEGKGQYDEELAYIHWLVEHLVVSEGQPQIALFLERLNRVAVRLKLTNNPLILKSTTLAGKPFDLESMKGKVVLVEIWSTGCKPCIKDFPALKRIYSENQSKGFEIVAICLHAEPERIRRFAADYDLPWLQLCDDPTASHECNSTFLKQFGIEAVPTTFLIDQNGTVVAQGIRPLHDNVEQDLEKWLSSLLP
jgi:thiol-disulfide isomerase/thioredoxin